MDWPRDPHRETQTSWHQVRIVPGLRKVSPLSGPQTAQLSPQRTASWRHLETRLQRPHAPPFCRRLLAPSLCRAQKYSLSQEQWSQASLHFPKEKQRGPLLSHQPPFPSGSQAWEAKKLGTRLLPEWSHWRARGSQLPQNLRASLRASKSVRMKQWSSNARVSWAS